MKFTIKDLRKVFDEEQTMRIMHTLYNHKILDRGSKQAYVPCTRYGKTFDMLQILIVYDLDQVIALYELKVNDARLANVAKKTKRYLKLFKHFKEVMND